MALRVFWAETLAEHYLQITAKKCYLSSPATTLSHILDDLALRFFLLALNALGRIKLVETGPHLPQISWDTTYLGFCGSINMINLAVFCD